MFGDDGEGLRVEFGNEVAEDGGGAAHDRWKVGRDKDCAVRSRCLQVGHGMDFFKKKKGCIRFSFSFIRNRVFRMEPSMTLSRPGENRKK